MKPALVTYLAACEPLVEELAVWGNGTMPLQINYYLTEAMPPLDEVTSVRAVLLRGNDVLVMRDGDNHYHVMPGGRREADEQLLDTLQRELLEETGWTLLHWSLFAVAHFHHRAPKPPDFPYRYPDFLQLIYVAEADTYHPEKLEPSAYEIESRFCPVEEARKLLREPSQQLLLEVALRKFANLESESNQDS